MEVKRIRIVPFTGHIQPIVKDGYNCPPYGRYIKGVDQNIYPSDYDWKISAYVIQEQTFWGWKAVDFISWDEYLSLLSKNIKHKIVLVPTPVSRPDYKEFLDSWVKSVLGENMVVDG